MGLDYSPPPLVLKNAAPEPCIEFLEVTGKPHLMQQPVLLDLVEIASYLQLEAIKLLEVTGKPTPHAAAS